MDKLMDLLTALGNDVDIVVKKRSKAKGPGRIQVLTASARAAARGASRGAHATP